MDAYCQICGKQWDARDPGVLYWPMTGTWECTEESACGLRAVDTAGWCMAPGPDGAVCQRPRHDDKRHAAIREWEG